MRVALFCHSLLSDWNHGNAHFLRGVLTELAQRGHEVASFEPEDAWSMQNLVAERGSGPAERVRRVFPSVAIHRYRPGAIDLDGMLDGIDLVIAHEWSTPDLIGRLGIWRARHRRARLLFHDTHHRMVSAPDEMARFDLAGFDGVLAFGAVIRDLYLVRGLARRAFVWHEAADARHFQPHPEIPRGEDLAWVGNWGDEERTREIGELLLEPVRDLQLSAAAYGVRYPDEAQQKLAAAGVEYRGWIGNLDVPLAFARARVTVHIPRRWYVRALPGIPTIRPFEALACGMPLVSAPWDDIEGLFRPGDFLVAEDGAAMKRHLRGLLADPAWAAELGARGRRTVLERHTCAHRALELEAIAGELGLDTTSRALARGA